MKSISFITIALISCFTSILYAQQCNNLLLKYFGFQPLNSPQSGADLPYCNHLKTAGTCCSAETVATFQARADAIADKLNNYDAARDLFLVQLNNRYYERVLDMLTDVNVNHLDDLQNIHNTNSTLGDELQAEIQSFTQAKEAARLIHSQFNAALQQYQYERTNCYGVALQVHASAWCQACDPNYQNEGFNNDGSVSFSDHLCQYITDACWPYFSKSAQFNVLIELREVYWKLLVLTKSLDGVKAHPFKTDTYKPTSTQLPVIVPQKWAIGDGNCWDLWSGDNLLVELLTFNSSAFLYAEPAVTIPEQAEIILEQAAIIAEHQDEEGHEKKQQQGEEEGEVGHSNMESAGPIQDEFEFEGRMLFDGRMLFGVLDLFEDDALNTGLNYNIIQDPGYYSDLSEYFGY